MRLAPLLTALAVLAGAGCAPGPEDADDFGAIDDFRLTERNEAVITPADLAGKVWVASFVFTRCAGPCSQITGNMARLQREFQNDPGVRLVTITVDPEFDTPEVLQRYAQTYGADPDKWLFLTGRPPEVYRVINKTFHLAAEPTQGEDRAPGNEVMHDFKLVVVDQHGRIRGYFDGRQLDNSGSRVNDLSRLIRKVRSLQTGTHWGYNLPLVNACLNGTCTVLLLLGYAAIRARKITLHKGCMVAALVVSAVFLASYLYFHIVIKQGVATRFRDQAPEAPEWVAYLYYTILGTHTVLAAVVTPLALVTAYLGLRDRLAKHVKLARWALPLWLYVTVTGVVVYWMLYQLPYLLQRP